MNKIEEIKKTKYSTITVKEVEDLIKAYVSKQDNISEDKISLKLYSNDDSDYYAFNIEIKKTINGENKNSLNYVEKYKMEKNQIMIIVDSYLEKNFKINIDFTEFNYFELNGNNFSFKFEEIKK